VALLLMLLAPTSARAAVTGSIEGTVLDQANGKRLAGVTVTVTSPALQGEQTEFTDASGHYIITELPPGEYLVRFYFSNINIERPGVFLQADKTLSVNASMPTQTAEVKTYRITEKAPSVDVGNTQQQTQITNELVRNTPIQGRTFADIQTLAPGAAASTGEAAMGKAANVSFSGATGPENNYLIDGVNTTNPAFGLVGTQLTLEFIGETEIITGGYNAEYGRATGGVVNVITKSGSNQFHGDMWFYLTPFQIDPPLVARSGEAIGGRSKIKDAFDFGFDLGGPIIKDKIWFYVGFAPSFATTETDRILRQRLDNNIPTGFMGAYAGDLSSSLGCPAWLDTRFCTVSGFQTQNLDSSYTKHYTTDKRLYNWIAKLNFQLSANHSLMVHYIGSPQTLDGATGPLNSSAILALNGGPGQLLSSQLDNTHDALLHYVAKLANRRLQLDVVLGYHYEENRITPIGVGLGSQVLNAVPSPLYAFETDAAPCKPTTPSMGVTFNPCPVLNYLDNGFGQYRHTNNQRISAQASATYFARLGGTHALKLGFDLEDERYENHRQYSGGEIYRITAGGPQIYREYGSKILTNGPNGDAMPRENGFDITTHTLNYGAYLRDSYNVEFVRGLTVNAGVRWEGQQVQDVNGNTAIGIYDNWAPRVGAIYDFTRKGRSKLFASYGRFYESIPLDINDRQFGGEGIIAGVGVTCTQDANGRYDPTTCSHPTVRNPQVNGGSFGLVSPALKGQYSEEVTVGAQYDVGLDLVLGATYIHRDLGRIIEDSSPDGGNTYIIINPGDPIDQGAVKSLQNQISSLPPDPASCNGQPGPGCPRATAQQQLALYQNSANGFPKPKRNYDALVLTASKRLSYNFLVLASYTYSRTLGNYPGLFQASNGQLDPNISSQYDLRELLVNRDGPLPNDRPHNLKIQGSYFVPFGNNTFVVGLGLNAFSGQPIEVLGSHPIYGRREAYVLPRGGGGRLPWFSQFDLHLSYKRNLSRLFTLEAYWDTFNLFNQSAPTLVDQEYTTSNVRPIENGTPADLVNLKTTTGGPPILNPNYGRPTAFQAPLSMRFGVRVSF
jgi:hypothetical protein